MARRQPSLLLVVIFFVRRHSAKARGVLARVGETRRTVRARKSFENSSNIRYV